MLEPWFWRRLLPIDLLIRAAPLIIGILGLIILIGSYWIPADTYPSLHDATKSIGQAVLGSGVVAWLLNTMKYIGIFRDAVHDVVFGADFLRTRNDLPQLWSRLTAIIYEDRFPDISAQLNETIFKWYIPIDKKFYYSRYDRQCFFSWADDSCELLAMTERIEYRIIASDTSEIIVPLRFRAESFVPKEYAKVEFTELKVNGSNYTVNFEESECVDSIGRKGIAQVGEIRLIGYKEYRIIRGTKRYIHLRSDPIISFTSVQFLLGTRIWIRCCSKLEAMFIATTPEEFTNHQSPDWSLDRGCEGLILPGQGYTLVLKKMAEDVTE